MRCATIIAAKQNENAVKSPIATYYQMALTETVHRSDFSVMGVLESPRGSA